jgi:SAM-dependent methyltransferase
VKDSIRDWWATNPMTYAGEHGTTTYVVSDGTRRTVEIGSREFFELADQRFYTWNRPLHTAKARFAKIFDYDLYRGGQILEVGCGMGCMAMNWAQHGGYVTAVDLNPVAVKQTRQRFKLYELPGNMSHADGENLPFSDNSFDYVYSWGVLHHSPNTAHSIAELHRVLKPGGKVGVMLYHRNSLLYRYQVEYVEGFLHLENQFLTPLQLASRYGDGARNEGNPHTWPVLQSEVRQQLFRPFSDVQIDILGTDVMNLLDLMFPLMGSKLLPRPFLKAIARRWGWSLWITGKKEI